MYFAFVWWRFEILLPAPAMLGEAHHVIPAVVERAHVAELGADDQEGLQLEVGFNTWLTIRLHNKTQLGYNPTSFEATSNNKTKKLIQ
jgi:hypothetical protein